MKIKASILSSFSISMFQSFVTNESPLWFHRCGLDYKQGMVQL